MNIPTVVHPRTIDYNGWIFEVVSVDPLTDDLAAAVVAQFARTQRLLKKDRGNKILTVVWTMDAATTQRLMGD